MPWNTSKSALRTDSSLFLRVKGELQEITETYHQEIKKRYSNTDEGLFSINNIQSHIHATRFHPDRSKANTYWDELDPFLAEWFGLASGYRANVFSAESKDKQAMKIKEDFQRKSDLRSVPSTSSENN